MPKFYHVHSSVEASAIEKNKITGQYLYFSKKDSYFYNSWITLSKNEYGGYIIYEIYIPSNMFTTSFNPRTKNKIVKITRENIVEYKKLRKIYKGQEIFRKEMDSRGIIGIDCTDKFTHKHQSVGFPTMEGHIWRFPRSIKIKRYFVSDT